MKESSQSSNSLDQSEELDSFEQSEKINEKISPKRKHQAQSFQPPRHSKFSFINQIPQKNWINRRLVLPKKRHMSTQSYNQQDEDRQLMKKLTPNTTVTPVNFPTYQFRCQNIPQEIIKFYRMRNPSISYIINIIQEACRNYLNHLNHFDKKMTEIFFNILHYETLLRPEEDNIYVLINNSQKNSSLIQKIYFKYPFTYLEDDISNISFILEGMQYQTIYTQIDTQLPFLNQDFNNQFQSTGKRYLYVQKLFINIFEKQLQKKLIGQLQFKLSQGDSQTSQAIIIKLLIIASLKVLLMKSFKSKIVVKLSQLDQSMMNCILTANYSKIHQFQLCIKRYGNQKQSNSFYREDNSQPVNFNYISSQQCKVSYFLEILIFIKECFRNGLKINIKRQNLFVSQNRFVYHITKPFKFFKNSKDLQKQNRQLSKIMQHKRIYSMINNQSFNLCFIQQILTIYQQNLNFLLAIFYQQIKKSPKYEPNYIQFILKPHIQLLEKAQIYKLIKQTMIHLESIFKQAQPKSINLQNKEKNQLIQIYFLLKVQIIMRLIYIKSFCQAQNHTPYYVYQQYINLISRPKQPLKNIYNNLFYPMQRLLSSQREYRKKLALSLKQLYYFGQSQENLHIYRPIIKQPKTFQQIKSLAKKISNINSQSVFSGIVGVKQIIIRNQKMTQVIEQRLDKITTVSFRQLKPEQGRSLLFIKMFPTKQSQEIQRFNRPISSLDPKLQQIGRQFIHKVKQTFNNLSVLSLYSPLIMMRNFILHKFVLKDGTSLILPQINIFSSIIQRNLQNPIRHHTFTIEYFINKLVNALDLPIVINNKFKCNIFLRFLTSSLAQKDYLQKVYKFLTGLKPKEELNINILFNQYMQKETLNSHFNFIKNHYKKLIITCDQLITKQCHDLEETKQQLSNQISNLITNKFRAKYKEEDNQINEFSNCYLISNFQEVSVICFIEVDHYKVHQRAFGQTLQQMGNLLLQKMFYTHAINMLFLYRQYRSPSYPSYQEGKFNHGKFNHLILICEQNIELKIQELRHMHHHPNDTRKPENQAFNFPQASYAKIKQQFMSDKRRKFTIRYKLQDFLVKYCYEQHQQKLKDNLQYLDIRKDKNNFFQSLCQQNKIDILEGLIALLAQANRLKAQSCNFNIRTVQLSSIRNNSTYFDSEDLFIDQQQLFVKPTFCCWRWHRNFSQQLKIQETDHYPEFYLFLHKSKFFGKQKFYFQKNYNCINYPCYHHPLNVTQDPLRELKQFRPKYDIGCVGYIIALIVFEQKDSSLQVHFIEKFINDYYSGDKQVSCEVVRNTIYSQFERFQQCRLLQFIKNMIDPKVSERKSIDCLIQQTNQGVFKQIHKLS